MEDLREVLFDLKGVLHSGGVMKKEEREEVKSKPQRREEHAGRTDIRRTQGNTQKARVRRGTRRAMQGEQHHITPPTQSHLHTILIEHIG